MHYDEYMSWLAYRRKHGPLNEMIRSDNGFSLLATIVSNALGGKAKMTDFLQYGNRSEPEEEVMTDPMEFIKMFRGK